MNAKCLCGNVKIYAPNAKKTVGACHCSVCRSWGGPLLTVDCGSDVTTEGEYSIYNSSKWAERAFCMQCGSHLFYRLKESQQHMLSAGLFENQNEFILDHQVFIDEKPTYYCFSQKTHDMTGAEIFAKFGS